MLKIRVEFFINTLEGFIYAKTIGIVSTLSDSATKAANTLIFKDYLEKYQTFAPIKFEIGTEQSIRKFDVDELEEYIKCLYNIADGNYINNIEYIVIQSGTELSHLNNIGNYDEEKLLSMINIAKKYKFKTKEHNGDYLSKELINNKFKLGLDSINVAPEFGRIETQA